jgi:acyl-CoA thioesterase FadM
MRTRLLAPMLLSALFVFTTSCGITGVKQCRLEQRGVSASGQFVLADASTVSAGVDLHEQRQSSLYPSEARLSVNAQSYSLSTDT